MNCHLPWKLSDMTGISAEKLQRNINQQVSYLGLYKGELVKEALRFNVASILKYACLHRNSFGNDPLSRKATDCLIVFLHSMAFQRNAFFTPSDSETSIQAKGCRNLHRLMLENLKATMRYIDYSVLLDHANGNVDVSGMLEKREDIYSEVFPDEVLLDVCGRESVNDAFFSIIDMENSGEGSFIDYDVKSICQLDDGLCDMLSLPSSSQDAFGEDSRYGIIGDMAKYLETPFIRHSGRFYSFVTRFSLGRIHDKVSPLYPVDDEVLDEDEASCAADEAEEVCEGDSEADTCFGEADGALVETPYEEPHGDAMEDGMVDEESVDEDLCDDEPDDVFEDEPQFEDDGAPCDVEQPSEEALDEYEDESEEFDEPLDEFLPLEDEGLHGDVAPAEPCGSDDEEPCVDDEPDEGDDGYALVGDDAYSYLDDASPEEFETDPLLEEQESLYDADDDDDAYDEEPLEQAGDGSSLDGGDDPYSERSLFDSFDDDEALDSSDDADATAEQSEEPAVDETAVDGIEAEEQHDVHNEPVSDENEPESNDEDIVEQTEAVVEEHGSNECTEEEASDDTPDEDASPLGVPSEEEPAEEVCPPVSDSEDEVVPDDEEDAPEVDQKSASGSNGLLGQVMKSFTKSNPVVQYVEQCTDEQRSELEGVMEKALSACQADGRDKMFAIPDTTISVCIFQLTKDPMLEIQRKENVGALMFADGHDSWNSLELYINDLGSLVRSDYRKITRFSFSDWEWKIVEKLGHRIMDRRAK